MLVSVHQHDDVTRIVLASPASRMVGYTASVYLAETAQGPVLVDTGPPVGWRALRTVLAERGGGRVCDAVRGALVTHQHEDHAGNVAALAFEGIPLTMGEQTRGAIAHVGRVGAYRRFTWGRMDALPDGTPGFDASPLVLVPTPGHTHDHHIVWDPERETLFGGDLFLGVKVRIAHPSENPRALADSLRAAAALRPRRLFDGHRGLVPDPVAVLEAKAAWLDETVGAVERLLDAGWSTRRVRDTLLGGESLTGYLSFGDYSRAAFVRAVRRTRSGAR